MPVRILPIACPFGRGATVWAYYLDTPRPALIDTGVAASPAGVIEPALRRAGVNIGSLRWILLTHGHWDHLGGAHTVREHADGAAPVAIHAADAAALGDRQAHLRGHMGVRLRYVDDPAGLAATEALLLENISGELGADRVLGDGDRIDLGRGITLEVVHTPGHSPGSATFLLADRAQAFVGDAVQVCGSTTGRFPLYVDPPAYRASLTRLRDDVRPTHLYLGHRFVDQSGGVVGPAVEGAMVDAVIRGSLAMERHIAAAADRAGSGAPATAHAWFAETARTLGYAPDQPGAWPLPLFATLESYRSPPAAKDVAS